MTEEPTPADAGAEERAGDTAGAPGETGPGRRWGRLRRWGPRVAIAGVALFLLIQLVPYGRDHTNPPVVKEPAWDSARTQELFTASCGDCHSNRTTWPWYSNVAPMSWLVQSDVDGGRSRLNVSEWQRPQEEASDAPEVVREGEMPPWQYTLIHSGARLSSAERDELAAGLAATFSASPPGR